MSGSGVNFNPAWAWAKVMKAAVRDDRGGPVVLEKDPVGDPGDLEVGNLCAVVGIAVDDDERRTGCPRSVVMSATSGVSPTGVTVIVEVATPDLGGDGGPVSPKLVDIEGAIAALEFPAGVNFNPAWAWAKVMNVAVGDQPWSYRRPGTACRW